MLSKPVEVYWSTFRLDWTVIPAAGDIIIQLQGNGTGWLFLSIETNTLSDVILGGFDASTGQPYVYVSNKVDILRLSICKWSKQIVFVLGYELNSQRNWCLRSHGALVVDPSLDVVL